MKSFFKSFFLKNKKGDKNGTFVKKVEISKRLEESSFESVRVNSKHARVQIIPSKTSEVEARLYGVITRDENVILDVEVIEKELLISIKNMEKCFRDTLTLDVYIPTKDYSSIIVKGEYSDITLIRGINTKYANLSTTRGDINARFSFAEAEVSSYKGDIDVCVDANNIVNLFAASIAGNILIKLNNVSTVKLSPAVINGSINKCHEEKSGYSANVDALTMNGDIWII